MKATSIKGSSPEQIHSELQQSMTDGFKPTLAILLISKKQTAMPKRSGLLAACPCFHSSFSTRVRLRRNKSIIAQMQLGSKKLHTAINHVLFKIPVACK